MDIIATIYNDYKSKFGIPRQSMMVEEEDSIIRFEEGFRFAEAVRGLEEFNYIWLIWQFSENVDAGWKPTVRPPVLGGNTHVGVFASRSPFRPNGMGLSSVKLKQVVTEGPEAPYLIVSGADLMDGTPILDIKPYIAMSDCHIDAVSSFSDRNRDRHVQVEFPQELLQLIEKNKQQALIHILSLDPRPSYQNDPDRIYGMPFADYDIKFKVSNKDLLTVTAVESAK